MSRAGRKRKSLDREPNGRVQRDQSAAVQMQRVKTMIRVGHIEPRWGSPLGLALIQKQIDPEQYESGVKYAAQRLAVDILIGLPTRYVRAIDYSSLRGGESGILELSDADLAAIKRFREADEILGQHAADHRIVCQVVVYDEPFAYFERQALISGLERLSAHYGLRNPAKKKVA